ncbi:hypothetical protein HZS_7942 [Henneguya salminicola]|nr:hypothetical protein HZS_7942 [Henneguya salminicola]
MVDIGIDSFNVILNCQLELLQQRKNNFPVSAHLELSRRSKAFYRNFKVDWDNIRKLAGNRKMQEIPSEVIAKMNRERRVQEMKVIYIHGECRVGKAHITKDLTGKFQPTSGTTATKAKNTS